MKDSFSDRLINTMSIKDISQTELARLTGITQSSISDYINNRYKPKQDKIDLLAKALGVTPAYLMGWEEEKKQDDLEKYGAIKLKYKTVPLLSSIACGNPIECDLSETEYIKIPEDINCDFALRASGDSMEQIIFDGDLVLIKKDVEIKNGDIVAVFIESEVTLKTYRKDGDKVFFIPENKIYTPLAFTKEELEYNNVCIAGKVKGVFHRF